MKLQILEPLSGGHHSNYIGALLPSVRRLLDRGLLSEATITITRKHAELLRAANVLDADRGDLRIDDSLFAIGPSPSMSERKSLLRSSQAAQSRVGATAVLCTSADYDIIQNASQRVLAAWPARPSSGRTAVLHYGYPATICTAAKERAKRFAYETAWHAADWNSLLMVNPLVYEDLRIRRSSLMARSEVLPDPVPVPLDISAAEARRQLGIPVDGRYVAFVGMMDDRKAIPELAAAFVAARLPADSRLLLAGQMNADYRRSIESLYPESIESGQVVMLDRHLSNHEVLCGYAAADVHAVLQYRRANLSANVLKAVSFGKPLVVDDHGHAGMVARRFGAGITCNVRDVVTISRAIVEALDRATSYSLGADAKRLMEFHRPENFARVALAAACGPTVLSVLGPSRSWDWACTGHDSGVG